MQNNLFSTVKWLFSLSKAFVLNAPKETITIIIMTLITQLSMMITFFLPMKVVILLGSHSTPTFLPSPFDSIDKNTLILALGILTLIFYGVMIVTTKISKWASDSGSKKLLLKNHKLTLFENQDEFAARAYSRYAEGLSNAIFSILGIVAFYFIYQRAGLILLLVYGCLMILILILNHLNASFRESMPEKANNITRGLSDAAFFAVFTFIVIDFLYFTPPSFVIALISIILSRVLLARAHISLNHFIALKKQDKKISALFFHDHQLPQQTGVAGKQCVWDLLNQSVQNEWIKGLLQQLLNNNEPGRSFVSTRDSGMKDIAVLIAYLPDVNRKFLIKLFDNSANMQASHEATLLLDLVDNLPTPHLILITMIESHHCHVFDITGTDFLDDKVIDSFELKLSEKLMRYSPTEELVDRYKRSKPMLWQEINYQMFERLQLFANQSSVKLIEQIEQKLSNIIENLQTLPVILDVPLNKQLVVINQDNEPLLVDWGKWMLKPIGANGSLDSYKQLMISLSSYDQYKIAQHGLRVASLKQLELANLISVFLTKYKQQRYNEILEEVIPVLATTIIDLEANTNTWTQDVS